MNDITIDMRYVQISHSELPVQKVFDIDGVNYTFNFDYNSVGDFYTFTILDEDENPLYAAKLCYLTNAMQSAVPGITLQRKIVALNLSDALREIPAIERLGIDNLDIMRICFI